MPAGLLRNVAALLAAGKGTGAVRDFPPLFLPGLPRAGMRPPLRMQVWRRPVVALWTDGRWFRVSARCR
jgi:hypothetical protein